MARRPALPGVDRRQQILEAALDVFAEQGFEGATTKDIAARADVTPGLMYFYFSGKDDLFFAAFAHQAERVFARFQLPADDDPDPVAPDQAIRAAVGSLVDALDEPRSQSVYRMMMRATFQSEDREARGRTVEDARCYMRDLGQRIGAGFRAYLDAEIARGRLRPVNTALAAQMIMHSTIMAAMRRASGDSVLSALSRDELVENILSICLHGLLPDEPTNVATAPPVRRRGGRLAALDSPAAPEPEPNAVALN